MADSAGTTNTSALRGFTELGAVDQSVVIWRSEGKNPSQIATLLESDFGITKSVETVRGWFRAGGRLEQGYLDYNEVLGDYSFKHGRGLLRRHADRAIAKMAEIMEGPDPALSLKAAGMFADKLYPDARPTKDGTSDESDDDPHEVSQEVLQAVERDLQIYRLGEEVLAAKELAKEADDANQ